MFRKIIGIIGALLAIGVIVMVALSPRTEGFCPGIFDFLKSGTGIEAKTPDDNEHYTIGGESGTNGAQDSPASNQVDTLSTDKQ